MPLLFPHNGLLFWSNVLKTDKVQHSMNDIQERFLFGSPAELFGAFFCNFGTDQHFPFEMSIALPFFDWKTDRVRRVIVLQKISVELLDRIAIDKHNIDFAAYHFAVGKNMFANGTNLFEIDNKVVLLVEYLQKKRLFPKVRHAMNIAFYN